MNDLCSFKKYSNLRDIDLNVLIDCFDEINSDAVLQDYFFDPWKFCMEQKLEFIQSTLQLIWAKSSLNGNKNIIQVLSNSKNVIIIGNIIIILKECNYNQCRCKKCLSVYYCSRLCPKKRLVV